MLRRTEKVDEVDTLCAAARTGDAETLRRASKSALNRSDANGMTPAMWSAARGHLPALRVIIERGADANRSDVHNNTPLHHAVLNNQVLCAVFLVHYGVNLWTLNDEMMSAYDVADASQYVTLAGFLDSAASRALADDWRAAMKRCQRAADDARRRLTARRRPSSASGPVSVDMEQHGPSQTINGWRRTTLPHTSSLAAPPSSILLSPRLANGRLFATETDVDTHSRRNSNDTTRRRRFWRTRRHRSRRAHEAGRGRGAGETVQAWSAASAGRQQLLLNVQDEILGQRVQELVARERLRLLTVAGRSCTTNSELDYNDGRTSSCGVDSQFFYRPPQLSNGSRSQEVTDYGSTCSDVYCLPADCIQIQQRPQTVNNNCQRRSSSSKFTHQTTSATDNDVPRRSFPVKNGVDEGRSLVDGDTIQTDLETLKLDEGDVVRQLRRPRHRRPQYSVDQRRNQSGESPALATILHKSSVSRTTRL